MIETAKQINKYREGSGGEGKKHDMARASNKLIPRATRGNGRRHRRHKTPLWQKGVRWRAYLQKRLCGRIESELTCVAEARTNKATG